MLDCFRRAWRKHAFLLCAGVLVLGAVCLYVAYSCQACLVDEFDKIRISRIPAGCTEVQFSALEEDAAAHRDPLELPGGREEVYDHFAVRKSRSVQDAYYVALASTIKKSYEQSGSEGHLSVRKFMFVPTRQNAKSSVSLVEAVTDADWERAKPMKSVGAAWDWPPRFVVDDQGIRFHGKIFPKTRAYLFVPLISTGERWVTLVSGSGWFPRGGEVLSPDFMLEQIYHPARYFSVATYDANSAELVREVHGWACYGLFAIRDGTRWFDDELLFIPSERESDLVCRY